MSNGKSLGGYIPLRKSELIDILCADPALSAEEAQAFRLLCRLIAAHYHIEHKVLLERLKAAYAPFDPDADTRSLVTLDADERQRQFNELFSSFACLLERADYKYLNRQDLEPALEGASAFGIQTEVDFRIFERLAIFARGESIEKRTLRRYRTPWRKVECAVPIYKRLVMIMKLRPHKALGRQADTNCIYLQLFKDIPELDLDMLLPGARVRMTKMDRSKIGLPLLTGIALTLWQIARDVVGAIVQFVHDFILFKPAAIWALASGALGYGVKSYFGYQQTRQRYVLSLTQLLYFQNLDTNAGVLHRLLDEAEEQEGREAILAYYYLWRHASADGWTRDDLDQFAEQDLERRTSLQIDFEHDDSLRKLEKLRIVNKVGDHYRAAPLAQALEMLEEAWKNYFATVPAKPAPVVVR